MGWRQKLLKLWLLTVCVLSPYVHAEEVYQIYDLNSSTQAFYPKPKLFDFVTQIPSSYMESFRRSFQKETLPYWGLIIGSTAMTIYYDEEFLDGAQYIGRETGLGNGDSTTTLIEFRGKPLFRGPTDIGSWMYFIGDGWTHVGFVAGFGVTGAIVGDYRALQTASQLASGLANVAIATQFLKHITGRESPYRSSQPRGRWDLFPNQLDYLKDVSKYDAFPSGHLATAMMTYTVVTENYPEHWFLKPIGITLMTLLSFQMMNNAVHWVSDYPLAIGMGYVFGKIAVDRGRIVLDHASPKSAFNDIYVLPQKTRNGWMLSGVYRF